MLFTLESLSPPDPQLVQEIWEYSRPLYAEKIKSRALLSALQNERGMSYCRAWTGCGSHEDNLSSGLAAAIDHLGAELPYEVVGSRLQVVESHPDVERPIDVDFVHAVSSCRLGEAWAASDRRISATRREQPIHSAR